MSRQQQIKVRTLKKCHTKQSRKSRRSYKKPKKRKSSNSLLGVSSKICKKKYIHNFKNSNANEMNRKKPKPRKKRKEECICKLLWLCHALHRKRAYSQALLLYLFGRPHHRPNSCYHQGVGAGFSQLGLLALSQPCLELRGRIGQTLPTL
jgi:hypothetical protein